MTTVESITVELTQAEADFEKARKARKGTKDLKVRIASLREALEAAEAVTEVTEVPVSEDTDESEVVTEVKRGRGRPRKYGEAFYAVKAAQGRGKRGRPSRETLLADVAALVDSDPLVAGIAYTKDPATMSYRDLAAFAKSLRERALNRAKVTA